ncbi:hypothetical protein ACIPMU_29260 [Streptomyces cyaneofuscatus]|uniref:hypothetical protein n=1 Tax=Streptomyces cyaneofuscatus TaxID=66883 RepID=UPI0037F60F18
MPREQNRLDHPTVGDQRRRFSLTETARLILYSISRGWAPLFDESILRDAKTVLHFPAGKRDAVGPISPDFLGGSVRNVRRTHEGFRETVNGSEAAASHRKSVSDEAQNS